MNTISAAELDALLKKSEAHASTCTMENYNTSSLVREQNQAGYLTIAVSPKMVKRAVKVFEMFLKRMFKEGFTLILDCERFYHCPASAIVVDGEAIPIRVKEKLAYTTTVDSYGVNRHSHSSGELVVEIYTSGRHPSKVLTETAESKWDELFDSVVPYLKKASIRLKAARLEYEEWRRRIDGQERLRKEHEQKIKDRASLAKSILEDIWLYNRAEVIRRYCNMVEKKTLTEEYLKKVEVARAFADWLDPTVDYEDELLSERYNASDFL